MKILVLTKRIYTGKDLIDDSYGRLFEIPAELEKLGHQVKGVALSYRVRKEGVFYWKKHPNMTWYSINAFPFGIIRYWSFVSSVTEDWKPDVIWVSSDILHVVLAQWWADRNKVTLVVDLYDNYESFSMVKIPFFRFFFRRACSKAKGLTAVSNALLRKAKIDFGFEIEGRLIPNAVRDDLFHKRDKAKCRQILGLPRDAQIIGTAGSISEHRSISDLFNAFELLAQSENNLWLVIAGPKDTEWSTYTHPRLIDFGVVDLPMVPLILSSLDVGVICNRISAFGQYCFPLKLLELIASKIPFVAANTGDVSVYLDQRQDCLYEPGNFMQLAAKIRNHLELFNYDDLPSSYGWDHSASLLFEYFIELDNA